MSYSGSTAGGLCLSGRQFNPPFSCLPAPAPHPRLAPRKLKFCQLLRWPADGLTSPGRAQTQPQCRLFTILFSFLSPVSMAQNVPTPALHACCRFLEPLCSHHRLVTPWVRQATMEPWTGKAHEVVHMKDFMKAQGKTDEEAATFEGFYQASDASDTVQVSDLLSQTL